MTYHFVPYYYVSNFSEPNDPRIFLVSGSTQFRRHSRLEIDSAEPIKTDEDATNLLKKYLTLKSRQQSEFVETVSKQRDGSQLPLQTSYVKVMRTNYIATNVYYEGLIYAVRSTTVCFPLSREDPGGPIYLEDDHVVSWSINLFSQNVPVWIVFLLRMIHSW